MKLIGWVEMEEAVKKDRESLTIPGPEVIKENPCSTQLRLNFFLLINIKIAKLNGNLWFKSSKPVIYPADKC